MPEPQPDEWILLSSLARERGWPEALYIRTLRSLRYNCDIPTRRLHRSRFSPVLIRRQDVGRLEEFVQAPHRASLEYSRLQIASRFTRNEITSRCQHKR